MDGPIHDIRTYIYTTTTTAVSFFFFFLGFVFVRLLARCVCCVGFVLVLFVSFLLSCLNRRVFCLLLARSGVGGRSTKTKSNPSYGSVLLLLLVFFVASQQSVSQSAAKGALFALLWRGVVWCAFGVAIGFDPG